MQVNEAVSPPCEDKSPADIDGADLLNSLSDWLRSYVWMRNKEADAIALWVVATWIVDRVYIAPILAILSATKRCGKTNLKDLLRSVVRCPQTTSGVGITSASLFRLNDTDRPTFLIDEAEKLGGRNADKNLVGLLNDGYRRGSTVIRCGNKSKDYKIRRFDAFGFRALFAIGSLWDTVLDRAIVVTLRRKPKGAEVSRFNARRVAEEGGLLARQIRRWVKDNIASISEAEQDAPAPDWLNDRACDNWAALFAVARTAGGEWIERAYFAARSLSSDGDADANGAERLIRDLYHIFESAEWPPVIESYQLCDRLNEIETSPWGEYQDGRGRKGLNAHKLARMLRDFEVRPDRRRVKGNRVCGYWLADLSPVFERYCSSPPSEAGHAGQFSNDRASHRPDCDIEAGTEHGHDLDPPGLSSNEVRPDNTKQCGENRIRMALSRLSPFKRLRNDPAGNGRMA